MEYGRVEHVRTTLVEQDDVKWRGSALPALATWNAESSVLIGGQGVDYQPDYGVLAFADSLHAATREFLELCVPGIVDAESLLAVARVLFEDERADVFERLTNPVFGLAEYAVAAGRGATTQFQQRQAAACGAIVKSGVRRVGHATALLSSMTSIPSLNLTPSITLPSCRKPRSRRQDFSALMPIL